MKGTITIIFLLFSFCTNGQLFTGTAGNIIDNGQKNYFDLSVSGLSPAQLSGTFGIEQVCINISHPAVEELYIYLQSPIGTIVELTEGSSCKGADYTNTCFDSKAGTAVTLASSPYTGTYKPIGYLGRFNTGQAGNGIWKLIVHDGVAFVNAGSVVSWSINFGNATVAPVVFTSSNLPIITINTNNQQVSDLEKLVSIGIIYNGINKRNNLTDPWNNFNGKTTIQFRGNTSRNFEKKPYSLEITDGFGNSLPAALLGMPSESDWDLIAMYQDKSLIRVPLTYDLSRKMGHYSTRFKVVELIINSEYQGIYALIERPKRDKYRIDIAKLTPADNLSPEITGGYIFKIDRTDVAGWYSLLPGDPMGNAHFYYNYVYPKDTDITIQQMTYIKEYMDNFETVMNAAFFNSPANGYPKYIDVASFIDYFIINELSKNVDAYRLSTYLYKDNIAQGGKLHIGPVWDYDLAWHNCNYGNAFDPAGWQYQIQDTMYPTPNWWARFVTDTNFVNKLYCRWNDLRKGILSINNMNAYIDSTVNVLNESQQRNFTQWPILGTFIFPNPQNQLGASYQGEVNDLKNWIANRIAWLDGVITGHCPAVGTEEYSVDNTIAVYPNPFQSSTTFALHLNEGADVSLKIYDVLGNEVALLLNEHHPQGELKIIFDRKENAAGIYIYRLKINDAIKTGKIIIQ